MEKRMLSTKELADYMGIAPQTIKNQRSAGTFPIPATRIGRRILWDKRLVDRYLDKQRER
jgi:excisionase family DNA binding protein